MTTGEPAGDDPDGKYPAPRRPHAPDRVVSDTAHRHEVGAVRVRAAAATRPDRNRGVRNPHGDDPSDYPVFGREFILITLETNSRGSSK